MKRKSNQEICEEFRDLLTVDFFVPDGVNRDKALEETKEWRALLWKRFNVIKRRMCPTPEDKDPP